MRVSVVIPCWNEEPANLSRAVQSAAGPHTEVIVVDDGSTNEDTVRCIDNLNVTVARIANRGPARAINVGCELAKGRYLLTLGSDDYVSEGFGSLLADALDDGLDTSIAYTSWQEFGARDSFKVPPPVLTATDMVRGCPIVATSLFRKESWESLGGLDETLRDGFEDWEWWVRLLLQQGGVGRHVAGPMFHYQIKAQSRNVSNTQGVEPLCRTRAAMLQNNPGHHTTLASGMLEDLNTAYALGQNQSPFAAASAEQARYWARRYGKIEGAVTRLERIWRRQRLRLGAR
ncbi:glycosyltransferase family 2 protein [Tessaracoccus sp. Z1128]